MQKQFELSGLTETIGPQHIYPTVHAAVHPMTTTVVAVTMTPAAVRTDGGSLRNRVKRRSMTFKRAICARLFFGLSAGG
jgi:hypothetical protein